MHQQQHQIPTQLSPHHQQQYPQPSPHPPQTYLQQSINSFQTHHPSNAQMQLSPNFNSNINTNNQFFPSSSNMMYNNNIPSPAYSSYNHPSQNQHFFTNPNNSQTMRVGSGLHSLSFRNSNQAQPQSYEQQIHENIEKEEEEKAEILEEIENNEEKPIQRIEYQNLQLIVDKCQWILQPRDIINSEQIINYEQNIIYNKNNKQYIDQQKNEIFNIFNKNKNTKYSNFRLFLDYKSQEKILNENENEEDINCLLNNFKKILSENKSNNEIFSTIHPQYIKYDNICNNNKIIFLPISMKFINYSFSYQKQHSIQMKIFLSKITFNDLPFFTVEDLLAKKIIIDYKIYEQYLYDSKLYVQEIKALKNRFCTLFNLLSITKNNEECIEILEKLLDIRMKKDLLQSSIHSLFIKLYMNWRNLQAWRFNHGPYFLSSTDLYHGNTLHLYLKKHFPNKEILITEFEYALNEEIDESQKLHQLKNCKFDEIMIRNAIICRQKQNLNMDGNVFYTVFVEKNESFLTNIDLCHRKERFRRQQIMNENISICIYVKSTKNGKTKKNLITKINNTSLEFPSFSCNLDSEFTIEMFSIPDSIEIELKYDSMLERMKEFFSHSNSIANVSIPIASKINKLKNKEIKIKKEFEFISNRNIIENENLSNLDYLTFVRPMNGEWNRNICGIMEVDMQLDVSSEYMKKQKMTVEVISDHRIKIPSKERRKTEELLLIPCSSIRETYRMKCLKMREHFIIDPEQNIPLLDKDIPQHLYKTVNDNQGNEHLFRNQILLDRMLHATIDVSEVVHEHPLPTNIFSLEFILQSFFGQRRGRLRPSRNYFPIKTNDKDSKYYRIVIQVLKCTNLCVRSPPSNIVQPFVEISFMNKTVRTFTSFGTNASWDQSLFIDFQPPQNIWTPSNMQSIKDDIEINIYDELLVVTEEVNGITMYDNINKRKSKQTQMQRTEKRYLGSIKIPFATLYFNGTIEGSLMVDTPLIHLGYHTIYDQMNAESNQRTSISLFVTLDPAPVQKNISIQKYFQPTNNSTFYEYCFDWCQNIQTLENIPESRKRNLDILVTDSRNELHLVCKYLRAIEPPMKISPQMFIRFVSCIPFEEDVHMIPGARDIWMTSTDFMKCGSGDWEEHSNLLANYFLWYEQQMQQQYSSENDWQTFVLIGNAIPHGNRTCFVLRRQTNKNTNENRNEVQSIVVINAVTGMMANLENIIDISIVFNQYQVFGNIQANGISPSSPFFSFVFEDDLCWKALFSDINTYGKPLNERRNGSSWLSYLSSKLMSNESKTLLFKSEYILPSLQEPTLEYISSSNDGNIDDGEYYQKRQQKLEYLIEKEFENMRNLPTRWNYAVCKSLREILVGFEPLHQNGGHVPNIHQQQNNSSLIIQQIQQIYPQMYGFPLYLRDSCSLNENAVQLVKNTKIHENENMNAEFARAVYIYPYTNSIASVWIYIAILAK